MYINLSQLIHTHICFLLCNHFSAESNTPIIGEENKNNNNNNNMTNVSSDI